MIQIRLFVIISILFSSLMSYAAEPTVSNRSDPRYPDRLYRSYTLQNGLKVLLISDPDAAKAAVSLSVAVGSYLDPKTHLGLAHYLEHSLFLGTKKYPGEGDYFKFIQHHNGTANAFTASEETNYMFNIDANDCEPALDRFSQFFIDPLFNQKDLAREVNAVNSEHSKNIPSDSWRLQAALSHTIDPDHPAALFHTGTTKTLADVTQQTVRQFYLDHYSSNLMTLVVLSKQPLNTLENWVNSRFSAIKNRHYARYQAPSTLRHLSDKFRLLQVQTLGDQREMMLTFTVPAVQKDYASKPLSLLAILLTDKGEHSLTQILKQRGLINDLNVEVDAQTTFSEVMIYMELTPAGRREYQTVIDLTYDYLALVKEKGLPRYIFDDYQRLSKIHFDTTPRMFDLSYVVGLAGNMHYIPSNQVERAPFLITQYKPRLFETLTKRLIPDNMLTVLATKTEPANQTDPFYGVKYEYTHTNNPAMSTWQKATPLAGMALPPPNPYIPSDLSVLRTPVPFQLPYQSQVGLEQAGLSPKLLNTLKQINQNTWSSWHDFIRSMPKIKTLLEKNRQQIEHYALGQPEHLRNDEHASIWFQPDYRFHSPTAALALVFQSPIQVGNTKQVVLSHLYPLAASHALESSLYSATQAGLHYTLSFDETKGMSFIFNNYSDKFTQTTRLLFDKLNGLSFTDHTFNTAKDQLMRSLQNQRLALPVGQALNRAQRLLEPQRTAYEAQISALKSLTLTDLQDYGHHLYDRTYIQGIVYGNLSQESVKTALSNGVKSLSHEPLKPQDRWGTKVIQLDSGDRAHFRFNTPKVGDSATVTLLQMGQDTPLNLANANLLSTLIAPLFFEQLRTQQQLGYITKAASSLTNTTITQFLYVQSGNYPINLLEKTHRSLYQTNPFSPKISNHSRI